ncbi:MAG: ABC transporter ATP-binding protein [Acetobacteraceae bacterium]|nr:ABC transporter ATP-binding protein [Acetobacteraceae bacterium]
MDLDLGPGEIVTVLGSNGVGKTTLMRAISGVYRPAGDRSGSAARRSRGFLRTPSSPRGLAQAPEGRQIFGAMTVAENLRLGAAVTRAADRAATLDRVLALFPVLRERYHQRAGSLSGGEQQMLCIGRALMAQPRLLLMDEPSLGLAPKLVRQVFDLIRTIRAGGTPVLLVEQNAKAALGVADRAYVMDGGRIVLSGEAAALAQDPRVRAAYLGGHVGA